MELSVNRTENLLAFIIVLDNTDTGSCDSKTESFQISRPNSPKCKLILHSCELGVPFLKSDEILRALSSSFLNDFLKNAAKLNG